jgi:hypothetical protein
MAKFKILPGLPPYGPPAKSFSASGNASPKEGLVVEFYPGSSDSWIGNFQPGLWGLNGVFELEPLVLVVSTAEGYLVDPRTAVLKYTPQFAIQLVMPLKRAGLLLGNGLWFERLDAAGPIWRTRRNGWDEMRSIQITGDTLTGEASEPGREGDT